MGARKVRYGRRFINRDFNHVGGRRTTLSVSRLAGCVGGVNGSHFLRRQVSIKLVSPCGTRMRCLHRLVGQSAFFGPCQRLVAVGAMSNFRKRRQSIVLVDLMHTGRRKRVNFLGSLQQVGMTVAHTHVGLVVLKSTSALAGRPFCGGLCRCVLTLRRWGGRNEAP